MKIFGLWIFTVVISLSAMGGSGSHIEKVSSLLEGCGQTDNGEIRTFLNALESVQRSSCVNRNLKVYDILWSMGIDDGDADAIGAYNQLASDLKKECEDGSIECRHALHFRAWMVYVEAKALGDGSDMTGY